MSSQWSFIQTASGKVFNYLDYSPQDIDLADIAFSLARINRFVGHTFINVNVANHSSLVGQLLIDKGCSREVVAQGLLHDATEAYLQDIPSPLKKLIGDRYGQIAHELEVTIMRKYGLPTELDPAIKEADLIALALEGSLFLSPAPVDDWPLEVAKLTLPDLVLTNPMKYACYRHHTSNGDLFTQMLNKWVVGNG